MTRFLLAFVLLFCAVSLPYADDLLLVITRGCFLAAGLFWLRESCKEG